MIINARLTTALYRQVLADLQRPHQTAFERVGFVKAKLGIVSSDECLVLFTDYWPVSDDDYLVDGSVGARINSRAIQSAMQVILDEDVGIFHVHLHPFPGRPQLSQTDIAGILPLISSFQSVGPELPHGILLLSANNAACYVWLPNNKQAIAVQKISAVGFPSKFYV